MFALWHFICPWSIKECKKGLLESVKGRLISELRMDESGIVLQWKGYNSTKDLSFQILFEDQDFTDVTLACENGSSLQAHKVILSSCSEFFSKILKQNPSPHPLVYLQGVSIEDLNILKRFMYIGRTHVKMDQIESFMNVSRRFLNQPLEKDTFTSRNPLNEGRVDFMSKPGKQKIEDPAQKKETLKLEKTKSHPSDPESAIKSTVLEELSGVLTNIESLSCPQCDFRCESKKVLKRHNYKKHLNQNLPCTESGCGKILKNRGSLQGHVKNKHVGRTNQYLCDECDYSSKWFSCLQDHIKRHTGNLIQCPQCEYKCTQNNMLKRHMESKHNVAEYKCEKCDQTTRTKKMMRFHVSKVHEGVRFSCDLCNHKATNPYNLENHKKRLHDQIEIICTFCEFKDSEKSRVLLHEKRKHFFEDDV